MSTITDARKAIRAVIEAATILGANGQPVILRWPNEVLPADLPADNTVPIVYTDVFSEQAVFMEHGRGLGHNRYRNPGRVASYCFVAQNAGLDEAESVAIQIADLLRSFDSEQVTCDGATVYPGGEGAIFSPSGLVDVGRYFWASAEIPFFFDSIG